MMLVARTERSHSLSRSDSILWKPWSWPRLIYEMTARVKEERHKNWQSLRKRDVWDIYHSRFSWKRPTMPRARSALAPKKKHVLLGSHQRESHSKCGMILCRRFFALQPKSCIRVSMLKNCVMFWLFAVPNPAWPHGSTSALFGPSPFWPRPASILQIHGKYVCEKKCPLICKEQDQKISQKDCQTECEKICREECHQIC